MVPALPGAMSRSTSPSTRRCTPMRAKPRHGVAVSTTASADTGAQLAALGVSVNAREPCKASGARKTRGPAHEEVALVAGSQAERRHMRHGRAFLQRVLSGLVHHNWHFTLPRTRLLLWRPIAPSTR